MQTTKKKLENRLPSFCTSHSFLPKPFGRISRALLKSNPTANLERFSGDSERVVHQ